LTHLRRLDVSINQFEGDLPESLGTIHTLEQLWFHEAGLNEPVSSTWLQTIPMASAVSRYQDFDCAVVNTIPHNECETLVAVLLALDPNGVYYSRRPASRLDRYGAAYDNPAFATYDQQSPIFPALVTADPCLWYIVNCDSRHLRSLQLEATAAKTPYELPKEIMQFPKSVMIWTEYPANLCYPPNPEFKAWIESRQLDSYDGIEPCQQ
jgi:hypothetical protein